MLCGVAFASNKRDGFDMNVLLVEDDENLAQITISALAMCGHDATVATTMREAVDRLSEPNTYPLVLLDLQLPDGRGEDVVHELRGRHQALPPILIVSGLPEPDLAESVDAIDAVASIRKPFRMATLCETVERIVASGKVCE